MEDFSVGQILFMLMNDENQVLPVRIIERVTRETSNGHSTAYVVTTSDGKDVVLSKINGIPYQNINDLRDVMLANVTKAINNIVSRAESVAKTKLLIAKADLVEDNLEKDTLQ
mgnify:CR=1 FL=1